MRTHVRVGDAFAKDYGCKKILWIVSGIDPALCVSHFM